MRDRFTDNVKGAEMHSKNRRRPSPAMIVATVALTFALAGTALAGPSVSKVTKAKVRTIANQEVDKRAPGLSVLKAKTADSASSAITASTVAANGVGAGALKGLTTIQVTSVPFANNTSGSAFIQCPAGTRVISGGGSGSAPQVLSSLNRISSPNGWRYDALNLSGANATITVFANCLDA